MGVPFISMQSGQPQIANCVPIHEFVNSGRLTMLFKCKQMYRFHYGQYGEPKDSQFCKMGKKFATNIFHLKIPPN